MNPVSGDYLPLHGGDIITASQRYGVAPEHWIDLSTGINPSPYPFGVIHPHAFSQLAYLHPLLLQRAAVFYENSQLLPVAGSQAAIQALPHCLAPCTVLIPKMGYQEHLCHWRRAGVEVIFYSSFDEKQAIVNIDRAIAAHSPCHIVVINPNNPTGLRFAPSLLCQWTHRLAENCYLIIDEAFMDMTPEGSVLAQYFSNNMIVLRSFGKFFGLAGIRLGFVFCNQTMRAVLQQKLGQWNCNGPAQAIAIQAFADKAWQTAARLDIQASSQSVRKVFAPLFAQLQPLRTIHVQLFSTYVLPLASAQALCAFFAKRGILLRLIHCNAQQGVIRIGVLNRHNRQWMQRLEEAVAAFLALE